MKTQLILLLFFSVITGFVNAHTGAKWDKLDFLLGNWIREGSGNPGAGQGIFTFSSGLNKKMIVYK